MSLCIDDSLVWGLDESRPNLHTCTPMCPSSGELIVSIRHLVYVSLYRWEFGVQVWMSLIQTCTPAHQCAHHQENYLYQYDIWYMSVCIDASLVCRFEWVSSKPAHQCAHHQENYLYQYIWYMSVCIDASLVCRFEWVSSKPAHQTVIRCLLANVRIRTT
jgi:hypothetical protein